MINDVSGISRLTDRSFFWAILRYQSYFPKIGIFLENDFFSLRQTGSQIPTFQLITGTSEEVEKTYQTVKCLKKLYFENKKFKNNFEKH